MSTTRALPSPRHRVTTSWPSTTAAASSATTTPRTTSSPATTPVGGAAVGGPGYNGRSWGGGILTAPNIANGPLLVHDASGTKPGQTAYQPNSGAWVYPGEFEATAGWGETRRVDVEVTPLASGSGLLLACCP